MWRVSPLHRRLRLAHRLDQVGVVGHHLGDDIDDDDDDVMMMLQTTLAVLITGEVLVGTEVGTKEVSSIGLLAACWLATAVEG